MSPRDVAAAEGDGPALVRPYALVGGRARTATAGAPTLPVESIVVTSEQGRQARRLLERGAILDRCATPTSVAELSARLRVPVGVIRILVTELAGAGDVRVHLPLPADGADHSTSRAVLERCLAVVQAL